MDSCRPLTDLKPADELLGGHTPLRTEVWASALSTYPDWALVDHITNGLTNGFRIGFKRGPPLSSATANMPSAVLHPQVISDYLSKEISLGRMLGPFPLSLSIPELQINRFGVIPIKRSQIGKMETDNRSIFSPTKSVNNGVDHDLCSLSYILVDNITAIVQRLGTGSLMAKIDIESAYQLVPVHTSDRPLQPVSWQDNIYIDPMLPFGLRSVPKIFNAIADAFQWIVEQQGVQQVLHYLDDFIVIGPPETTTCREDLHTLLRTASKLGVPIAHHKPRAQLHVSLT